MSEFEKGKNYFGFNFIKKEYISDIKSEGHLFIHEKTGAELFYAKTKDINKVFFAAFKTPPENSKGTAHIIEHSVLCGSKKYPVKEPFNELAKGSLNTYLNALTYSDKTVYPIASTNDKDFNNLKDVYLDAVFNPLIYEREEIFMQEGHCMEIDEKSGMLNQSGVVYNEMKGAYSDPDDVLVNAINRGFFADSPYKYDSGGDPEEIVLLTYEEFLDFHRKFYHPSNCYFYFYGNMDILENLKELDEKYLSKYERGKKAKELFEDKCSAEVLEDRFSVSSEEELKDNCTYAYTKSCGLVTNSFLSLSMGVLSYILVGNNSAPLKKRLIESKICKDIFGWFRGDTYEMSMTFGGKKGIEGKADEFFEILEKSLLDIYNEGIDKKLIESTINAFLFYAKEEDFGYRPKGLKFGMSMMHSWMNGGDPFEAFKEKSGLEKLRELGKGDYFERLIKEYLIDNKRLTKTILYPDINKEKENEKAYAEKMELIKKSLSEKELSEIADKKTKLEAFQAKPDSKEDLEKIPIIEVKDIEKNAYKPEFKKLDESYDGIYVPLDTDGIEYVSFLFDVSHINEEEEMWLGFLGDVLGKAATKSYSYEKLPMEIDSYTGGVNFGARTYSKADAEIRKFFVVDTKALEENTDKLFNIINEILFNTIFEDTEVNKKIIDEVISLSERNLTVNGHSEAVRQSLSGISEADAFNESVSGSKYLKFVKGIKENIEIAPEKLKAVSEKIFTKSNFYACIGGGNGTLEKVRKYVSEVYERLDLGGDFKKSLHFKKEDKKTALISASKVMYNAAAADYRKLGIKYSGYMQVAKNIIDLQYLWNKVRVMGGAYGCGSGIRKDGFIYLYSYRDPNLDETYNAFGKAAEFLKEFSCDEREMAKFIIGTINSEDKPKANKDKFGEAIRFFILDVDFNRVQRIRDEMLSVTVDDIRKCADVFEAVCGMRNICSVGAESIIEKSGKEFNVKDKLI